MKPMLAVVVLIIVVAGAGVFFAQRALQETTSVLRAEQVAAAKQGVTAGEDRIAKLEEELRAFGAQVDALRRDVAAIAEQRSRQDGAGAAGGAAVAAAQGDVAASSYRDGDRDARATGGTRTVTDEELEEFRGLLARFFGGDAEEIPLDQQERFWALARTSDALDRILDDLEETVSEDPRNTEPRMDLAEGYIAKLLTVPDGPERGLWSMKAEEQWREVIEDDPKHYKAHVSIGINYSYYPPFLNKTGEAIEWLEKSRALLVNEPIEDDQVQNFTTLSRLYQRQGNIAKARQTLNEGLERHAGNEDLNQALQQLPAESPKGGE